MSIRPVPYGYGAPVRRAVAPRPTFIPRAPVAGGPGAGLGAGAGGIAGIIGGLGVPLLCLGCLSALSLVGLFATMIGAAAYMNEIQQELGKGFGGSGTMLETNMFVLFAALLCSIYVLFKHQISGNQST